MRHRCWVSKILSFTTYTVLSVWQFTNWHECFDFVLSGYVLESRNIHIDMDVWILSNKWSCDTPIFFKKMTWMLWFRIWLCCMIKLVVRYWKTITPVAGHIPHPSFSLLLVG
jgi:hypothetical protein